MPSLVVRNATIVTPASSFVGDVLCEDGTIAAVARPGQIAETAGQQLDATGLHVLPGIIDPHVHSRDPGQDEKECFEELSRSAAVGGVTTTLVMPNTVPPVATADDLRARVEYYAPRATVDFGLWAMAVGEVTADQAHQLRSAGAVGLKVFWGYALDKRTGALVYVAGDVPPDSLVAPPSNGDLWNLVRNAAAADLMVGIHCEDRAILDHANALVGTVESYDDFLATRPVESEAVAIATVVELSRATGAHVHVLHISSAVGCDLLATAQAQGVAVSGETCPQYLLLDRGSYDEIGPMMKVYPPIREADDTAALWQAVHRGTVCSLGSDHAPHTAAQKDLPLARRPAGVIGVETLVQLLLDQVATGKTTLQELSARLSESTAKLYGLYPTKGSLLPGTDADLTIVDLGATWTVRGAELHARSGTGPWEGRTGRGVVRGTVVRGQLVMWDGNVVPEGSGAFVPSTRP